MELGSLLRAEGQSVYNQLLLYLSVSYNKVFSGLAMLASKDDTYIGPKDLKTTQHLVSLTLLLLHVHVNAATLGAWKFQLVHSIPIIDDFSF